jgi:hypothetical protein
MSTSDTPYRLHVLGAPDLRAPDGRRVTSVLSQPKRLGLLTYLALSPGPVSRATVVATFWPDSDEGNARNALSQAVFYLRRSLAEDVVVSAEGDRLWTPPERLWCDASELLSSPTPSPAALEAATGDLLEGWNADDSQPLQEWLDTQRRRIAERAEERRAGSGAVVSGPATAPTETVPAATPLPGGADVAPSRISTTPPTSAALSSSAPSSPPRRRRAPPVWAWLAAAAAVTAVAAVFLIGSGADSSTSPVATTDLAVLMPRVTSTPDAPAISAQAIDDELLAHLPEIEGLRIRAASYADNLGDFRRQLGAIGGTSDDVAQWILEVSVRAAHDEARVVGVLYRSPAFDVLDREAFEVTYHDPDAVLLDFPQEVARGVVGMIGDVLGEGRAGR